MKELTKKELISKLKALNGISREQRKEIACSLIGHSNIVTNCFGYVHCARCDEQIGDTLMGLYDDMGQVVVNHNCKTCKENWAKMTWKDKYLVKYNMDKK